MTKEVKLATAIIRSEGKYLLLRRSKNNRTNRGKWQLPEGKLEPDERPEDAVKRELKEETNLDLIEAELVKLHSLSVYYPAFGKVILTRAVFSCKANGNVKISEEHDKFGWFSEDDIKRLRIVNGTGKLLTE